MAKKTKRTNAAGLRGMQHVATYRRCAMYSSSERGEKTYTLLCPEEFGTVNAGALMDVVDPGIRKEARESGRTSVGSLTVFDDLTRDNHSTYGPIAAVRPSAPLSETDVYELLLDSARDSACHSGIPLTVLAPDTGGFLARFMRNMYVLDGYAYVTRNLNGEKRDFKLLCPGDTAPEEEKKPKPKPKPEETKPEPARSGKKYDAPPFVSAEFDVTPKTRRCRIVAMGGDSVSAKFHAECAIKTKEDEPPASMEYAGMVTGSIRGSGADRRMNVGMIEVQSTYKRARVGTKLWETLAQEACARGVPLVSEYRLKDAYSNEFWEKQHAKGRAVITGRDDRGMPNYRLNCDHAKDLSALRGMPKRTKRTAKKKPKKKPWSRKIQKFCTVNAFRENIRHSIHMGKDNPQAAAIAYSVLRRACNVHDTHKTTPKQIVAAAKARKSAARRK